MREQKQTRGNRVLGAQGEEWVARALKAKGWKVLDRNWSCRAGELDIVALQPPGTVVFVEVKTRRSRSFGLPCQAVTPEKQKHLLRAAALYVKEKGLEDLPRRFDVAEVLTQNGTAFLHRIENAFS